MNEKHVQLVYEQIQKGNFNFKKLNLCSDKLCYNCEIQEFCHFENFNIRSLDYIQPLKNKYPEMFI